MSVCNLSLSRCANTAFDQLICGSSKGTLQAVCKTCVDKVGHVINAGATRLTSSLGGVPADPSVARMIDHTLLKPDATPDQIAQLCYEARKFGFASVCVNPGFVALCADLLKGSDVKVCTVIGFPLGASAPDVKAFETETALRDGATEIDMVINIGAGRGRDHPMGAIGIAGGGGVDNDDGTLGALGVGK